MSDFIELIQQNNNVMTMSIKNIIFIRELIYLKQTNLNLTVRIVIPSIFQIRQERKSQQLVV